MRTRTRIWLGLGMLTIAAQVGAAFAYPANQTPHSRMLVAQHAQHAPAQNGDSEQKTKPQLSGDLAFALKIAQLRGHLLIGDELVSQGQWAAGLPHFLHPVEEIYDEIRGSLSNYATPPFESALKRLTAAV
jgi:hypothetical protein